MTEVTTKSTLPELLATSGLMSEDVVCQLLADHPDRATSSSDFADYLVESGYITRWQAGKILQGKHRGFFLGQYMLLRHLAKGGMSTLYVAVHTQTGEVCALKVLPPAKANQTDASYLSRFLREAELTCRLRHPNIIRVDEVLTTKDAESGVHFMAMELLNGSDLFNKVSQHGPLPVRQAAEIIRQTAIGIEYAHSQGLIHRDIKPGNVFETEKGEVKILDLGLAGLQEGNEEENLTRDYNERVLGTADYLAPEQAVDSHRADSRADIYALGCTLYFVLTGRPPFIDGTLPQRILAHQTKDPQDVRQLRRDVPAEILDLLGKMLVKKRTRRIQTAQEVAEVLEQWLEANNDDPAFDGPAQMVAEGELVSTRPLQKIRPSRTKTERETPTDSIRAAETQTGPSVPALESVIESDQSDFIHAHYSSEFESFLKDLDGENGAHSVMSPGYLQQQRRQLSVLVEPVTLAPEIHEKPTAINAADDLAVTSRIAHRFKTTVMRPAAVLAAVLIAALIGFLLSNYASELLPGLLKHVGISF